MRILLFSIALLSHHLCTTRPAFRADPARVTVQDVPAVQSLEWRPSGGYPQPVMQPKPETVSL